MKKQKTSENPVAIKIVMLAQTMEQTAAALAFADNLEMAVSAVPTIGDASSIKKTRTYKKRATKGRTKAGKPRKRASSIAAEALLARNPDFDTSTMRPSPVTSLFMKLRRKLDKPRNRQEIGLMLAEERGEPDTRATGPIVTKWVKTGALHIVG